MFEKLTSFFKTATKGCFFGFVIVYLSYFLVFGKGGVINYIKNSKHIDIITIQETNLEGRLSKMKNKVERMYTENLDADLFDEQYRRATGEIKKNEVIYYYE